MLLVAIGAFRAEKHFNWVPYDELTPYRITVVIGNDTLSDAAVRQRYRRPTHHRENRSIHNLIALVRQYEETYGRKEAAQVTVDYAINGGTPRRWSWPADIHAAAPAD